MKPYPLVSDLRERCGLPCRAPRAWWSAKNWNHALAESRSYALNGVRYLFKERVSETLCRVLPGAIEALLLVAECYLSSRSMCHP